MDELDYAFPIGALGGIGCFLAADLLGLEAVLAMNDDAGEILDAETMILLAKYLQTDRLGIRTGEGFYLHGG